MKSKHNNYSNQTNQKPLSQRRLKTKPTLTLLAILLIGNILWFISWILPDEKQQDGGDEVVATIDKKKITRQDWMAAMETRYGKETLQILVNEAVMEKAAQEYDIKVSDEEIDLEIALIRSAQDKTDSTIQELTDEELQQKVRAQLILEKVLTKDVVTDAEQVADYYEDNQSLYNIPTTYRTSIIIVESEKDAKSVKKELEEGSDFSVLARERSLDTTSASLGGDIGFITKSQKNIDTSIPQAVQNLNADDISEPFVMKDGRYGIVYVKEVNDGKSFTYEEVKEHIERVLSLEQLPTSVRPEAFWKEFNASWFYGES
ncbi:peptidyl-prolyl cis-trans isomerase [Ureibacillus chungkukjangi]|uniref:peptidylprolyl isomerase n=1 Tax=Ureibacillus chungkukjangi TaxID=1202712 RepID=A0A318TNQ1_9BACL|nr:peptidyl-prolyl cis-trans isomerase [Ureibacillus chungkukjangi]MCM3389808.1 peptidyl-prolyl cis-trans isomerase [Ureibacillus chungkukjangi]PYF04658.1 foldase protein PrsA [Ureibacillus chungkukjangi]HCG4536057.1 peptidyl-prolyl cis-trans isomerase [Salmonella enterica subsp. enterica serovar Typhi str. AG3]